jgi:hypothetical protein
MARVTVEPTVSGVDVVRGKNVFTSIYDYTADGGTVSVIESDGRNKTMSLNGGRSRARVDLQKAGWWAAGTLVVALIVLRIYSRIKRLHPKNASDITRR